MKYLLIILFLFGSLFSSFGQADTSKIQNLKYKNLSVTKDTTKNTSILNINSVGYSANTKHPLGYYLSLDLFSFHTYSNHKFDFSGKQDLLIGVSNGISIKTKIAENYMKSYSYFLNFSYEYRNLDFSDKNIEFNDYQIALGYFFIALLRYDFSVKIGSNYLQESNSGKLGFIINSSISFGKVGISLSENVNIYKDQTYYNIDLCKYFTFPENCFLSAIYIGIGYEKFYTYEDINLSLIFCF